jgi:hypothetical protein
MNFYNNRRQIAIDFPFLQISLGIKIWMVLDTIMVLLCFVAASFLLLQQTFYLYNDLPYLDMMRMPNVESHYGFWVSKNEENVVSIFFIFIFSLA